MVNMQDKELLNKLDGSSVYKEVQAEKIEKNRKRYKQAIKTAVLNADDASKIATKASGRADKTQTILNDLVDGGLEGFLASEEEDDGDDDDEEDETGSRAKRIRVWKANRGVREFATKLKSNLDQNRPPRWKRAY
jgi:hypothetical protein